jgi:hypothetical protein
MKHKGLKEGWTAMLRKCVLLACAVSIFQACTQRLTEEQPDTLAPASIELQRIDQGNVVEDRASTGGVSLVDVDSDGDDDLYVTNGYDVSAEERTPQANRLYLNDGQGKLVLDPDHPLSNDSAFSSGSTWSDYDNDGDLDLFVGTQYRRANLLYRNEGNGLFSQVMEGDAAVEGGHPLGAAWADFDNDRDLDLLVANWGSAPVLYVNDGAGGLDHARVHDFSRTIGHASSVAIVDVNGDGAVDAYVGNWPNHPGEAEENLRFLNRDVRGNWLRIRLVGTQSNRSGIGARIALTTVRNGTAESQLREVSACTTWRSQDSLMQHFGLVDADEAASIEVRWPSGAVSKMENVAANQFVEIIEG